MLKKQEKAYKKAQTKNLSISIRRLVLRNTHIIEFGIFKDVFFDLVIALSDNKTLFFQELSGIRSKFSFTNALLPTKLQNSEKKKVRGWMISKHLNIEKRSEKALPKSSMPPTIAIELIRPSKLRVQILANIVKSTLQKYIYQSTNWSTSWI